VSRRDFVKTGFVAGLAAGMAAGAVVGQPGSAEAQAANPMGRDWWPGPSPDRRATRSPSPDRIGPSVTPPSVGVSDAGSRRARPRARRDFPEAA
jgi:hypothetical protein